MLSVSSMLCLHTAVPAHNPLHALLAHSARQARCALHAHSAVHAHSELHALLAWLGLRLRIRFRLVLGLL